MKTRMGFAIIFVLFLVTESRAQRIAQVTGWFDGCGQGLQNHAAPSPCPQDDGVTHGSFGTVGAGPFRVDNNSVPANTSWIPLIGTNFLSAIFRDLTKADPNDSASCAANIGTFPAVVLKLQPFCDDCNTANHYIFMGNMVSQWVNFPDDGPTQDPIVSVVRYGNGHYDLQGAAAEPDNLPVMYFPNPGIDAVGTSPTVQYLWGHGPLFTVVQGPELTTKAPGDSHGDSLYLFFGGVRADQDTNCGVVLGAAVGTHTFGIATANLSGNHTVVNTEGTDREIQFNFNRGLNEEPRHMGWRDLSSPNYTGLRDAGVKVKRWDGTPDGVGQEVDGWFTPIFARIATRTTPRTGTVSITSGSSTVVGTNTQFLTEVAPYVPVCLTLDNQQYPVASVQDDTHLTLVMAAAQSQSGTYGLPYLSRFGPISGVYTGGYFYLFIALTGRPTKGSISLRIPSDPSQDNGLARNGPNSPCPNNTLCPEGSIKVEMWYRDGTYPLGAYHPINSTIPIAFPDDDEGGANPPVPMDQAFLLLTGGNTPIDWTAGPFASPASSSTFYLSDRNIFGTYIHLLRLDYTAANQMNPWTIAIAYDLHGDGQCPNCTGWVTGNYTLPSIYKATGGNAVLYPLSDTTLLGYWYIELSECPNIYEGSGLLPFTIGAVDLSAITPPTGLVATGQSTSLINVSWNAVPGATSYDVWRHANNESDLVRNVSTTNLADTNVTANKAYLYMVRANNITQTSDYSAKDIATAIAFTDDPITPGVTQIKASHVTELRTAVDAATILAGGTPSAYTDPTLTPESTVVKIEHIQELRDRLNQARQLLGLTTLAFSDSLLLRQSALIRSAHVTELRAGVH